jgi:hypothetical protein
MFDDAIKLFSAIVSTLNLVSSEIRTAKERKRARLEKLSNELKDVGGSILGWYNKIAILVVSMVDDIKAEKVDYGLFSRYRRELVRIQATDEFYSKCHNFVGHQLPRYQGLKTLNQSLWKSLAEMAHSHSMFESTVFSMKNRIWRGLWLVESRDERLVLSKRIDRDLRKFKKQQDSIMEAIGRSS